MTMASFHDHNIYIENTLTSHFGHLNSSVYRYLAVETTPPFDTKKSTSIFNRVLWDIDGLGRVQTNFNRSDIHLTFKGEWCICGFICKILMITHYFYSSSKQRRFLSQVISGTTMKL